MYRFPTDFQPTPTLTPTGQCGEGAHHAWQVTFEEFFKNEREHYHGLDHDHADAVKHSKEAFDILDRNKDGKLTRAEDRSHQPADEHEYEKINYDDDDEEEDDDDEEEEEQDL